MFRGGMGTSERSVEAMLPKLLLASPGGTHRSSEKKISVFSHGIRVR
jgi:hypothetical protein